MFSRTLLTNRMHVLNCSLFAALSYGITSMAMVFINKAVIMQYAHSMTLLTVQVQLHDLSVC